MTAPQDATLDALLDDFASDVCSDWSPTRVAEARAKIHSHFAASAQTAAGAVSETTQRIIDMLRQRDAAGRAKYGTTLDRADLTHAQWTLHLVEELLDGAGYALRMADTEQQPAAHPEGAAFVTVSRTFDSIEELNAALGYGNAPLPAAQSDGDQDAWAAIGRIEDALAAYDPAKAVARAVANDWLIIGKTRTYGADDWFREMQIGGVTFLAPLDDEDRARHILGSIPVVPDGGKGA